MIKIRKGRDPLQFKSSGLNSKKYSKFRRIPHQFKGWSWTSKTQSSTPLVKTVCLLASQSMIANKKRILCLRSLPQKKSLLRKRNVTICNVRSCISTMKSQCTKKHMSKQQLKSWERMKIELHNSTLRSRSKRLKLTTETALFKLKRWKLN